MKYKIELTEKQFIVLSNALELYGRIGMGQFEEILNWKFKWNNTDTYINNFIRSSLTFIKCALTGLEWNAYRGIASEEVPEDCKISYDIYQVIRNKIAWTNNPEGGILASFDKPMKISSQKLPTCEVIEE